MDSNGSPINWMNVGSKFKVSIKDLANKIATIVGYRGKIIWDTNMPDGTPRKKIDS